MFQESIFHPVLGMMLLTMLVWLVMFVRRVGYLTGKKIDPQAVSSRSQMSEMIPDSVAQPANNFLNLLEMPVIFYVLCLFLFTTGHVDGLYVKLAYGFFIFRVLHSLIHCTYNKVMHRLAAYLISCAFVWLMLIRIVRHLILE